MQMEQNTASLSTNMDNLEKENVNNNPKKEPEVKLPKSGILDWFKGGDEFTDKLRMALVIETFSRD